MLKASNTTMIQFFLKNKSFCKSINQNIINPYLVPAHNSLSYNVF